MDIVCNKCGLVNDYRTEKKSNNLVAYCNGCDAYIKNIPQDVPKLYVGKYKGIPISDIEDLSYLKWAVGTLHLTSSVKMAVLSRISSLEYLSK
jgi:hypothetical protein